MVRLLPLAVLAVLGVIALVIYYRKHSGELSPIVKTLSVIVGMFGIAFVVMFGIWGLTALGNQIGN